MTFATNDDWVDPDTKALLEAVVLLETPQEAAHFLRDLCTRRELTEMSKRWAIARLLDEGGSYRAISEETGASTATVTRIAQWLNHGTGGYRSMLERFGEPRT